jgi:hypothetical protein
LNPTRFSSSGSMLRAKSSIAFRTAGRLPPNAFST